MFIHFWQITKDKRSHPVQTRFYLLPVRHDLLQQPVKALTVVVLSDMAKLMKDDVVNAAARRRLLMDGRPPGSCLLLTTTHKEAGYSRPSTAQPIRVM